MTGYIERAKRAENVGDKRLQIEDTIRNKFGHIGKIERMLREWPL